MSNMEIVKSMYQAFAAGEVDKVLGYMHPEIRWTESAGYRFGGVFTGPQEVMKNVFATLTETFESFSVEVERFIDGGSVIVMQGQYLATGKGTGKSAGAAVAHALELSDGKVVRFDQYLDSATLNAIIPG